MQANFNVIRNTIKDISSMEREFVKNNVHYIMCGMDGDTKELIGASTVDNLQFEYLINWLLLNLKTVLDFDDVHLFIDFIRENFISFLGMDEDEEAPD